MSVFLAQQFIESILGCLTEGVIIIDSSDRIITWNAAVESILHLESPGTLGKRYQDVFSTHPQLGLIGVLHSLRMQHPPGTSVRTSLEGTIPEWGQINLNLSIHLLADTNQAYRGRVTLVDHRTAT